MTVAPGIRRALSVVGAASLTFGILTGAVALAPPASAAPFDCLTGVSPTTGASATTVGSDCVIPFTYGGSGSSTSYSWTRPSFVTSIQYLVVGGGGGGGAQESGGLNRAGSGGGGAAVATASAAVSGSTLSISVGAGGARASLLKPDGSIPTGSCGQGGSSSSIASIATANGGSGGGPGGQNGGSSGNGNAGGFGSTSGGGGGGSTGVGVNGTSSGTAEGGSGTSNSISGTAATYGRGGRGGATSGGGTGESGTASTGNGGGGGSTSGNQYGGNGGSGIVIIRYSTRASTLTTEPPASAVVDQTLTQSPVVTLSEAGAPPTSGVSVTAALGTKPTPSGTQITPVLDGTTTVTTDASGLATFDDLQIF